MAPRFSYDPDKDIPDLAGKVILMTGGTAGIGKEAILKLVKHNPGHVYFTGRNSEGGAAVVAAAKAEAPDVPVSYIQCDHESLASVDAAAAEFQRATSRLDIMICNAGVMCLPPGQTQDGYEKHMGINHVAHALWIRRLLPTLQRTAAQHSPDVRVVTLSSRSFQFGTIDFAALKTPQALGIGGRGLRYFQSKLANVLYSNELARRFPNITAIAIHPGIVHATDLHSGLPLAWQAFTRISTIGQGLTNVEGAYNTEWAATTDKKNVVSGHLYQPVGLPLEQSTRSKDPALATQLWDWTEAELDAFERHT